jgi:hypothetical protein
MNDKKQILPLLVLVVLAFVLIALSVRILVSNTPVRTLSPLGNTTVKRIFRQETPTPTPTKPRVFTEDELFSYHNPDSILASLPNEYVIVATGDVIPARSVNSKMVTLNNFTYPFEKTVSLLQKSDLVFINLESPFVPGCMVTVEGMKFCGDERTVEGLAYAGVGVASLANNHAGNYGEEGVKNTVTLLANHTIASVGLGQPVVKIVKNKKFGFLGYNDIGASNAGITAADTEKIKADIKSLRPTVDYLIVTFHWGTEYVSDPTSRQKEVAHTAIDAGADVIIGNHPHWVQGVEQYKGKFITYAHGNYVFDQMWSQETREGVLGRYTFTDAGLINVQFFPVIIEDYSQPRFASEGESKTILERMKASSQKLLTAGK